MESEVPPTAQTAPVVPAPSAPESSHDRHTREFEQSVDRLEGTVEHWLVRALKIAVPAVLGVIAAAVGMYVLGQHLRDRAERKRVARAIRRARSPRGRREAAEFAAS